MALVTISEASRLTGKARKTIYAHIQSGKVSSRLGKDKVRRIDTSELVRVYDLKAVCNNNVTGDVTPNVTPGNVTGNTINLTPEQLSLIIKDAVAEAIKEVMPLLLENKPVENIRTMKTATPKNTPPSLNNYLDDIPTFGKKY